ncbi:hypothetical protein ACI4CD_28435, partial [Klebsiella pneumoniae]|uniref:hypothetical protein n=1 Tax=Klebsiella pneumoniae TaxID=573 RepID=UPI0038527A7B
MGVARRLGRITYRCEPELDARFGRAGQGGVLVANPQGATTKPVLQKIKNIYKTNPPRQTPPHQQHAQEMRAPAHTATNKTPNYNN